MRDEGPEQCVFKKFKKLYLCVCEREREREREREKREGGNVR